MGTKISELPQQISLQNTDLIPVVSEGVTSKVSYQTFKEDVENEFTLSLDSDNLTLAPQSGEESSVPLADLAGGLIKTRTLTGTLIEIKADFAIAVQLPCALSGYTPIAIGETGCTNGSSGVGESNTTIYREAIQNINGVPNVVLNIKNYSTNTVRVIPLAVVIYVKS